MKIALTIEKDGEKLDVAQLSFECGEEDTDAFMSKVYASISEYKIAKGEFFSYVYRESLKRLNKNVLKAIQS